MKILLVLFSLLVAVSTVTAQQASSTHPDGRQAKTTQINKPIRKSSPPIEEIADRFYTTYETGAGELLISFEKKAGKWRVDARTWQAGKLVHAGNYLFYDIDSGGYQRLPLASKKDGPPVDYRFQLEEYDLYNYHIQEYYGYNGWYKDVIATLSTKKQLSDSSLHSLARAYSAYAECLLTNQTGDGLPSELFDLPMTRNCMTPAQREKYHQIQENAILTYARLKRQNPKFETITGKVPVTYANEVMVEFHAYLTFADEFAASFPLPDHLYPDSTIKIARRVLEKCPSDAILLSLGDNDFYPMLYAQRKMGVRQDVRIVNRNLLGLDRYIYLATQPQLQSKPVRISVPLQTYYGNTNDYLFLKDNPQPMPFDEVTDTIRNGHPNENGILTLPGKAFIIRRTRKSGMTTHEDTVRFQGKSGFIVKEDWILLDILNNLNGRRLACETDLYGSIAPLNVYFTKIDNYLIIY